MAYPKVPKLSATYLDGFFDLGSISSTQPKVLVLGTAKYGRTDAVLHVTSPTVAVKEYKGFGTLVRGMQEVVAQGADNLYLRRLPTGTPATLSGVGGELAGGAEGLVITTVQEDAEAGTRYKVWFDATVGRLAIYDSDEEEWIYDTEEELAIDTGLISVSGSFIVGDGVDLGSQSAPITMEEAGNDVSGYLAYSEGSDGDTCSLIELYEALEEAYEDLDWMKMDFIVPMGATLNATNLADLTNQQIIDRGLSAVGAYPDPGELDDVLGYLFVQEYLGKKYFWWDMDGDGNAEIFPSVGSASSTTDINGVALTSDDFHEVNFAYQLAQYCKKASTTWHSCIGFMGVEGPDGFDRSSLATWIGELPDYTEQEDGSFLIASTGDNGSGLLGNKFLAGKRNFRSSVKDGGFVDTDSEFLDGVELEDDNEHVIDIGKHVLLTYVHLTHTNNYVNPSSTLGRSAPYIASAHTSLAGKYATLPEKEEANGVNGLLKAVRLDGLKIPGRLLNDLLSIRFVGVRFEPGIGVIVAGSKTAARPDSDYTKISTIRSVNRELNGLRAIATRFQGKENSPSMIQSLKTSCQSFLKDEKDLGYNNGADIQFQYTSAQAILGQLTARVKLVPPLALESIDFVVSLAEDETKL